jgi:hypothetical protein
MGRASGFVLWVKDDCSDFLKTVVAARVIQSILFPARGERTHFLAMVFHGQHIIHVKDKSVQNPGVNLGLVKLCQQALIPA